VFVGPRFATGIAGAGVVCHHLLADTGFFYHGNWVFAELGARYGRARRGGSFPFFSISDFVCRPRSYRRARTRGELFYLGHRLWRIFFRPKLFEACLAMLAAGVGAYVFFHRALFGTDTFPKSAPGFCLAGAGGADDAKPATAPL